MHWTHWALLFSGGIVLAGLAYPAFARSQPGWKTGSAAGGTLWSLWYGAGGLAYLAGMGKTFGWLGLVLAIPAALAVGFFLTLLAKQRVQLIALIGPVLANLWFMVR